jgi:3-phenylpropionate/cinnamic acid dioxygenase small subunit
MTVSTLQALVDRAEIIDLFSRYAAAIDGRDAVLYRSCFTDEVDIETSGTHIQGGPAQEWVDLALRAVGVFEGTQHVITNHRVALDGDEADCVANLQARHWNGEATVSVGGEYTTRLRRTGAGWRIAKLAMRVRWTQAS